MKSKFEEDDFSSRPGFYIIPEGMEEYKFLRCYLPEIEDYEVTYQAMMIQKNQYPLFQGWEIVRDITGNGKKKGFYLFREGKICVSADCFTSFNGAFFSVHSDANTNIKNLLQIYKYVYHTIGNFIPIPRGCNTKTWGNQYSDTFSKKLNVIHDVFDKRGKNKYDITSLDSIEEKTGREKLKYWIARDWEEKSWRDFCTELYLQDYVNIEKNWEPLPFYEKKVYIPKNYKTEMVENTINNCIRLIIKRGYRITNNGKEIGAKSLESIVEELKRRSFNKAIIK